jgi:hypothetical protein
MWGAESSEYNMQHITGNDDNRKHDGSKTFINK